MLRAAPSVMPLSSPRVASLHDVRLSALLRPATLSDAGVLASTIVAAFEEYRGTLTPPSLALEETIESVTLQLEQGGAFLAEKAGQILGCVLYRQKDTHLYLSRLSVVPSARGLGLARCLTAVVEQQARVSERACVQLSVRRALPGNRAMYVRFGYQHAGYGVLAGCPSDASEMLEKHLHVACHLRVQRTYAVQ